MLREQTKQLQEQLIQVLISQAPCRIQANAPHALMTHRRAAGSASRLFTDAPKEDAEESFISVLTSFCSSRQPARSGSGSRRCWPSLSCASQWSK